jgi:hypothetical protein
LRGSAHADRPRISRELNQAADLADLAEIMRAADLADLAEVIRAADFTDHAEIVGPRISRITRNH